MPLQIPSRRDVSTSLQTYVRAALPSLDPTPERRSKIGAWVRSLASALFDWYVALKDYGDHEPFPQSARGAFLFNGWWRPVTKLDPIKAAPARGQCCVSGTANTPIPKGMRLTANSITYTVDDATAIVQQSMQIESITYLAVGKIVLVRTRAPHNLATGLHVTVASANAAAYNGTFEITVIDDQEFTYRPATAPLADPGSPLVYATWAMLTVSAGEVGTASNVGSGGTLQVLDSIPGVATTAYATYRGIQGGADDETAESYRARVLRKLGTDYGAFTGNEIVDVARTVPGVTRVWVKKATLFGAENGVNEGQVKVAFLRDNDVNPLPSSQEVMDVRTTLIRNSMTANTAEEDVIVQSPIAKWIDVRFTRITPDSVSMREAIRATLVQWFRETADYETSVTLVDLECVIKSAYDLKTRTALKSFELLAPTDTVTVGTNEFPMLRSISFGSN